MAIRIYVHGVNKQGKQWRTRYNYPGNYKLSDCLAKSGVKGVDMTRITGVGTEEGALTLHVRP